MRTPTCLLAIAAAKKAKAKARQRSVRRERKVKRVWMREWLLKRHKYGMYDKLREADVKSFRNFVKMNPDKLNQMVEDLTPRLQKKTTNCRNPLSP